MIKIMTLSLALVFVVGCKRQTEPQPIEDSEASHKKEVKDGEWVKVPVRFKEFNAPSTLEKTPEVHSSSVSIKGTPYTAYFIKYIAFTDNDKQKPHYAMEYRNAQYEKEHSIPSTGYAYYEIEICEQDHDRRYVISSLSIPKEYVAQYHRHLNATEITYYSEIHNTVSFDMGCGVFIYKINRFKANKEIQGNLD